MTNDEFIDESQQKHTGRRSRDRSDFVIPSCFVIIHLSLVFALPVELFSLSWQHAGTSPDGQSGFNERRRDDHSLTLWRERFEGIEIKAVEGKGENGHFGQRQFFG